MHQFNSSQWRIRQNNMISKEIMFNLNLCFTGIRYVILKIYWVDTDIIHLHAEFYFYRFSAKHLHVLEFLVSMLYETNEWIRLPSTLTTTRVLSLNVFAALGLVTAYYRLNVTFSTSDLFARPERHTSPRTGSMEETVVGFSFTLSLYKNIYVSQ